MNDNRPRIAVTMGDPAGIGPELCLRLLAETSLARECVPIIFGDAGVLRRVAEKIGVAFDAPVILRHQWRSRHTGVEVPSVVSLGACASQLVVPGVVTAANGQAAFLFIQAAINAALAGQVAAVTTAPINKAALHAAGHHYPGHTEIFAERMHAARSCMAFFSDELVCSLVTVHVGYAEVPALLTPARILDVIELTADALRRARGREPKLLVCGLNPHAGEAGLFGEREEERAVQPAVLAAQQRGLHVTGPVPPDTAFTPARRKEFDAVVCLYHDQALIPVKALAFDSAVNTTLGLPVPRTSVDHGTAFDIAWQGVASPGSLFSAVRLAAQLAR